jgi:hypothetical protein
MIEGSPEWFRDGRTPIDKKKALARKRALSGPLAVSWRKWYAWHEEEYLVRQDGTVVKLPLCTTDG